MANRPTERNQAEAANKKGGTTAGTVGSGREPDMRNPGGEHTTVDSSKGPFGGTTTGLGGVGETTAGGGVTDDLSSGSTPEYLRKSAVREAKERAARQG